ncbi:MAG: tRNA (adenine(22)-N(1))-methyltransferase TrmK [Mariniblastus sp.]
MPKLDARLIAVTKQIRCESHVDIGSDHGLMLVSLLKSGRINRGIAIEKNQLPFENSQRALVGLNAEVRLGDGLAVLKQGEAECLSICGLGSENMARILSAHPERLPDRMVLQPNLRPEVVRKWGRENGFHLTHEHVSRGYWPYAIMTFERANLPDPIYDGLDLDAALIFGPYEIRKMDDALVAQLIEEREYWQAKGQLDGKRAVRLAAIERLLAQ